MATDTAIHRVAEHDLQASVEEYAARSTEALLRSGGAALKDQDYKKALHIFERLSEKGGRSFLIELGKVHAFNGLGQWEQSIVTLKGMLGLGDDKEVWLRFGLAWGQLGQYDDALDTYSRVMEQWPDDGDAWVFRSAPLVSLGRMQVAIESLEKAYARRSRCSSSGIWSLYYCSALLLVLLGITSIETRSLPDLENKTEAFIWWREEARRDNQADAFGEGEAAAKGVLTTEQSAAYEEFMLSVRLGSIEDPFDRWKALGEEIGKVWPEGVSAVEAIREQRE
ncbi:MAG: domain protein component of TonB system [Dehalococcoidia bacterium]|nr:domain protein component of TonB system [Dehalococcoidia bacterium]